MLYCFQCIRFRSNPQKFAENPFNMPQGIEKSINIHTVCNEI
jgi:hypothetical protein